MPWPSHIVEQFDTITPLGEVDETEYCGPFNGLLLELFPGPEHFMIVPQYKRPTYPQSIDFTTIFIVQRHKHPVFFIEIKPSGHLKTISGRSAADQQMRERFEALADQAVIATLYGVSALGTQLCLYTYDSAAGTITPEAIERNTKRVNDRAPAAWWDVDILAPDGEQRFREVVTNIKAMCNEL
ncbi:hypothetical protein BU17DRAFT_43782 [Hysterangium stoloniferum]|nr:hypothetical protein BU17DRAFT_43757 [Hysterangium stoloniferum]KAF8523476.1 hypothetical protein BU17DRAFT_43782 [Hysterangium stoloniferum]